MRTKRWRQTCEAIFDKGSLPDLLQQRDGPQRAAGLRVAPSAAHFSRYRSSYLSFLDTAGESLGTRARCDRSCEFLAGVDAFIVMLDPFTLPGAPGPPEPCRKARRAAESNGLWVL